MMNDILRERERALEYEFCQKVDEQLCEKLRVSINRESQKKALSEATGISDQQVLDELVSLGLTSDTVLALPLFPLVWMAWADRHVEPDERNRILEATVAAGVGRDSSAYHMIESWLEHQPSEQMLAAWEDYVWSLAEWMPAQLHDAYCQSEISRIRKFAGALCFRYGFHDAEVALDAILRRITDSLSHPRRPTAAKGEAG